MPKIARYVLFIGLIAGILSSLVICFIALDHNPQNVYDDKSQLLLLLYSWAAAIAFPFTIISAILFLLKRK